MSISVVVCAQNVSETLNECLSSLMPVYGKEISEIIVVDGGSKDGSLDIARKYPVKIIADEYRNPYIYSIPRNKGWMAATADLVMFLDADAYITSDLIPLIQKVYSDQSIGIVGVASTAPDNNLVMRSIGQWWHWHFQRNIKKRMSSNETGSSFYSKTLSYGKQVLPTGPCYIVKRKCLEEVTGFDDSNLLTAEDIRLSQSIISRGWKAGWILDTPVYHYPPRRLKELIKQRFKWGQGDGKLIRQTTSGWRARTLPAMVRLGTPLLGLWLAIYYKNPFQVILLPLAHYAWIAGFLRSNR